MLDQPAIELSGESPAVFGAEVWRAAADMPAPAELVEHVPQGQSFADIGVCTKATARIHSL